MIVQALGWCLLHFVWQAALVGAAYALVRWMLPRGNPRYLASMLALVVLAGLPLWTFWHEWRAFASTVEVGGMLVSGAAVGGAAVPGQPVHGGLLAQLQLALPWLVLAWGCGVTFLGLRVVRQWRRLRAVVRAAETLPVWQARAEQLGRRLGLGHAVRVLASVRIATPTLVGWVRPVVVMPLAVLARMPAEQVDWILAHELAHLRRLDHLANLFQVVLETLLFYHPVVHWISRDARHERELCCDALALRAGGGRRRDFVAALAGLEEFRVNHSDLALAATGGLLAERAWFVAGLAAPRRRAPAHGMVLLAVALVSALLLAIVVRRVTEPPQTHPAAARHALNETAVSASVVQREVPVQPNVVAEPAPRSAPAPVADISVQPPPLPRTEMQPFLISAPQAIQVQDLHTAAPVFTVPAVALAPPVTAPEPAVSTGAATVALPVPLRVVAPEYPGQALQNGTRGRVVVAFTLDANGRPRGLDIVSSVPGGVFDSAALAAIRQWRFKPPAAPGRQYRQTISFSPAQATGGGELVAAQNGCRHVTGSHICRDPSDTAAVVKVDPAARH
jgi:TonB family protein